MATAGDTFQKLKTKRIKFAGIVDEFCKKTPRGDTPTNRKILIKVSGFAQGYIDDLQSLMEQVGFPNLEGHKKKHKRLLDSLTRMIERMEGENVHRPEDGLFFVRDWFKEYVEHDLVKFHKYLVDNNVITAVE